MKKILVAINFSEQSNVIFKYAMKLAQHFNATVGFAFVITETQLGEDKGINIDQLRSEYVEQSEEKFRKFIQAQYGKQYHKIAISTHIRIGKVSEELPDLALALDSDLLLVGKSYQRKFYFFEDTAGSLISTCSCPVMTIPEDTQYSTIKRIIYASAFLLEDCAAIFELQQWLNVFKGELICINVSKDETQLAKSKRKMAILERLFPQENISFKCFVSDEALAIERYTSLTAADILCSLHKDRSMFQWLFQSSLSKEMTYRSQKPMIVFHQHMLSAKI